MSKSLEYILLCLDDAVLYQTLALLFLGLESLRNARRMFISPVTVRCTTQIGA